MRKHTLEKRRPPQQIVLGKLEIHLLKNKIKNLSLTLGKNQLKMDQEL